MSRGSSHDPAECGQCFAVGFHHVGCLFYEASKPADASPEDEGAAEIRLSGDGSFAGKRMRCVEVIVPFPGERDGVLKLRSSLSTDDSDTQAAMLAATLAALSPRALPEDDFPTGGDPSDWIEWLSDKSAGGYADIVLPGTAMTSLVEALEPSPRDAEQCRAREYRGSGRCPNPRMPGRRVCDDHGPFWPPRPE